MDKSAAAGADSGAAPGPAVIEGQLRPLSATRRVVARRMAESSRSLPAVTLHRSLSMATLLERRRILARQLDRPPIIDAMLAHAVGTALAEFELLNGSFDDDALAVRVWPDRNIAVAADTEHGLTAVVLRAADRRDEIDLSDALVELVERARARRSRPDDLTGATFTITNLGSLGVDSFTPIVTPPQAGVLGVGRIRLSDVGSPATLSLTFDHRVVDGAYGARFLGRLEELLTANSAPD